MNKKVRRLTAADICTSFDRLYNLTRRLYLLASEPQFKQAISEFQKVMFAERQGLLRKLSK